MNIKNTLLAFGVLLTLTNSVFGQWIYQKQGGAFDDKPLHLIVTGSGNYGFAFRCKDSTSLEAVYLTPEEIQSGTVNALNQLDSKLLIRIDENDVVSLSSTFSESNGALGVFSPVSATLIQQLIDAKKRVSIAIETLEEISHEQEFNVSGSTKNGNKLVQVCNLKQTSAISNAGLEEQIKERVDSLIMEYTADLPKNKWVNNESRVSLKSPAPHVFISLNIGDYSREKNEKIINIYYNVSKTIAEKFSFESIDILFQHEVTSNGSLINGILFKSALPKSTYEHIEWENKANSVETLMDHARIFDYQD